MFDTELQKTKLNLRETKIDVNSQNELVNKIIKDKLRNDSEIKMNPVPSSEIISREIELQVSRLDEPNIYNLVELNLHNSSLTELDVDTLKNVSHLKKLILSFNKLKFIKEISHLVS